MVPDGQRPGAADWPVGVEDEDVVVGQREPHQRIAGAAGSSSTQWAPFHLDDGPEVKGGRRRWWCARGAVRPEAVRQRRLADDGGPVAGVETSGVDAGAVGRASLLRISGGPLQGRELEKS